VQLYTSENREYLPPDGNITGNPNVSGWYTELPKVMGIPPYASMAWRTNTNAPLGHSVWICPGNKRQGNGVYLFHYCLNNRINHTGEESRPVKITSIPRLQSVIYLFDSKNQPPAGSTNFAHTNIHGEGANFLFLDGHAKRFANREYYDFKIHKPIVTNPLLIWDPYKTEE
jgi:prepilin-type processing-associated H-X9-DG protein